MNPIIRKKHKDMKLNTTLNSVLSVRLREGYTIKDVSITKGIDFLTDKCMFFLVIYSGLFGRNNSWISVQAQSQDKDTSEDFFLIQYICCFCNWI